ncbi:hypothetical protein MRX96_009775 [Rhipicephalus microplus]
MNVRKLYEPPKIIKERTCCDGSFTKRNRCSVCGHALCTKRASRHFPADRAAVPFRRSAAGIGPVPRPEPRSLNLICSRRSKLDQRKADGGRRGPSRWRHVTGPTHCTNPPPHPCDDDETQTVQPIRLPGSGFDRPLQRCVERCVDYGLAWRRSV